MQETDKIWMNGELVDWADAKVHVGVHGLHYGTGVFEGIRCYDTPKGPAVFRLADHLQRLHDSARLLYMEIPYTVEELREATHELVRANGLPACYIRPIAFFGYGSLGVHTRGNPVETVIMSWPWGAYLGEDGLTKGITREGLVLEARRAERDPARRRRRRGSTSTRCSRRRRRSAPGYDEGDPAHRRRLRRGRARGEHLRGQGRPDPDAAAVDVDPARDHARLGDPDRAGSRLRRRGDVDHPRRPLPRRRGVHDRHRGRGDAGARGRRHRDRGRPGHARDPAALPRHASTAAATWATGRTGRGRASRPPRLPPRTRRAAGAVQRR